MIESLKAGLATREFEVVQLWGLGFDLIAKKESTYLIKSSENINSLKADVAQNIRRIAGFLKSFAMVVGEKRGNESLLDQVVYQRYGIPAFNERTFFSILDNDLPVARSEKGGIVVEVNPAKLDTADVEGVAQRLGVSKRCVFYYLSGKIAAVKMEKVERFREEFGDVFKPYELKRFELTERGYCDYRFVQRLEEMGFETTTVGTCVCDLLSKLHEFGLASKVGNSEWSLRYHANTIKHISKALGLKPLFVLRTKKKLKKEIKGVPVLSTKTINDSSAEEFFESVEA